MTTFYELPGKGNINGIPILILTGFLLIAGYGILSGQSKVALPEEVYFTWKSIQNKQLTENGRWFHYELNPNKGDGILYLHDLLYEKKWHIPRAKRASFDEKSNKLICLVSPPETVLDSLKRLKIKDDQLPTDTLVIFDPYIGSSIRIPDIKSLKVPLDWHGVVAFTLVSGQDSLAEKSLPRKMDKEENTLICYHLENNERDTFLYVRDFILAEKLPVIFINNQAPDSSGSTRIWQLLPDIRERKLILESKGTVKKMFTSPEGKYLAFLADTSLQKQNPIYHLKFWSSAKNSLREIAHAKSQWIPDNWIISEHFNVHFSEDEQHLYFGIAPQPIQKDTTLLPNEIVEVEIWHYQDEILYTEQKVKEKEEKNRSYEVVFDIVNEKVTSLGSPKIPVIKKHQKKYVPFAIGIDNRTNQKVKSWQGRGYKNMYLISQENGEENLLIKDITGEPEWSPGGRYIYWYEQPDTTWYAYDVREFRMINLTGGRKNFADELNDEPDYPSAYGWMGWSADDKLIYLYDRFDIWSINPEKPAEGYRITHGRENQTVYRYIKLDPEESHLSDSTWLLHVVNEENKQEKYIEWDVIHSQIINSFGGKFSLDKNPLFSKTNETFLFTREDFQNFPDVFLCRDFEFEKSKKVTQANPEQELYLWGNIELVSWKSYSGKNLKGLLIKPEDFVASKKHPMIVNFYDRSSDRLYKYNAPAPHRSTINYSFYVSNGYVIFIPDVIYETGYPGRSAYDAVVSGTREILKMGFVDSTRIGIQGHSWGGYQIAHILTKTGLFACAEAGAPVVNMTSAYGGIRWETGLSRMFQYEHTQSRIGASLWEKPNLYLENSPLFELDRITTPVLILHNDMDGAVPWYQGIEFFVAMRRLNKPAWLLNYNGEPHWPVKWQNRLDFNRRMFQFFNHFLKGAPMPRWMKSGIPAVEKGISDGLELSDK